MLWKVSGVGFTVILMGKGGMRRGPERRVAFKLRLDGSEGSTLCLPRNALSIVHTCVRGDRAHFITKCLRVTRILRTALFHCLTLDLFILPF